MTQIERKDRKAPEIESKHFGMNYTGNHLLWLEDMGNDIETWFAKDIKNCSTKEIGNFGRPRAHSHQLKELIKSAFFDF